MRQFVVASCCKSRSHGRPPHHLRIRIGRDIADKATGMARERGLELADVMRMRVTLAVLTDDFAIYLDQPAPAPAGETRAFLPTTRARGPP